MKTHGFSLGRYEYVATLQVNKDIAVILCNDPLSHERVVCKTASQAQPSPEILAALNHEYELTLKAQSTHIIEVMGRETSETGAPILVLRHQPGKHFEGMDRPMPPKQYLQLFVQIVQALASVHARKMIHRNINPTHIIWNPETQDIRIIDFSLATDIFSETAKAEAAETLLGKLPYISPEQTGRMNRKVDFRSDYYSLGMTFFQFLTGRSPFVAKDAMGWVYSHITEQPPLASAFNPSIPRELSLVIQKLLAKNPEDRYQSSYGLIRDLQQIGDESSIDRLSGFKPGAHDIREWLQIPEKLYGRTKEVDTFLSFFDQVKNGHKLLCTISGASGMGKSVLVHEIQKPVVESRGIFISGKCDQYKRNVPYAAIRLAFTDLIKQQLARSVDEIEVLKQQILNSLGDNAQVISEIIPELEAITGKQEPVPRLEATESRVRFQRTFAQLLNVFTAGDRPLVAFLDDLQWSDIPSLRLIEYLMVEAELHALMIIAVFRDNEVQPGHPLLAVIEESRKISEVPGIQLSPLLKESIAELLGDTLQHAPQQTLEFAEIIFNKTAGNPFHITEMIKTLHDGDAISFNNQNGRWQWDFTRISQMAVSSDVVELMVSTLQKCPASAQDRLKVAACIGAQFELNTLSIVSGQSPQDLIRDLWTTIEKGLIIPLGETYKLLKSGLEIGTRQFHFKFQHDRVHEAAYVLIPAADRPSTHLEIGRILNRRYRETELDRHLVEIVRHYNLGAELIREPVERIEWCQLNLLAAEKARNTVAYDSCLNLLRLAQAGLPANGWQHHYALSRKIHMAMSEAAFFIGDLKLVDQINSILSKELKDPLDQAEFHHLQVDQHLRSGRFGEAAQTCRDSLHALGIHLPAKARLPLFILQIKKLQKELDRTNIDEFHLKPQITDRKVKIVVNQLLTLILIYVTRSDRLGAGFAIVALFRLVIKSGNSPETAYAFLAVASLMGNVFRKYQLGYRLAKVGIQIDELCGNSKLRTSNYFSFALFNGFHTEQEKLDERFALAIEAGLASGDQHLMPFSAALLLTVNPYMALEEANAKSESHYQPIIERTHNQQLILLGHIFQRHRQMLTGALSESQLIDKAEADRVAEQYFTKANFFSGSFCQHLVNAMSSFILKDIPTAYASIRNSEKFFLAGRSTFHEIEFHFFNVLISVRAYRGLRWSERRKVKKSMRASLQRLKGLAAYKPYNFHHRYQLMQAEYLHLHGRRQEAAQCYANAMTSVPRTFVRDLGLVHELAAQFHRESGQHKIADLLIVEAFQAWRQWTAHAKVRRLLDEWPVLAKIRIDPSLAKTKAPENAANLTTQREDGQTLDAITITRAAQTLSSQVEMEGLIKQLMKIILENAGAHYAVLMLKDKEHPQIKVVAKSFNDETTLVNNASLAEFSELSLSVMLYTTRVNETVIIDAVDKDERFRNDSYLLRVRPKSILAMPITLQGRTIGFFYLESRMMTNVFTQSRIQVLNILGTQAAISLENAQLYGSLERKVRERTMQLAEKSRDIRSILAHIKQGILTVTDGLKIHPEYSQYLESILGTKEIAQQDFMRLCFKGSQLSPDTLDQIKNALGFSLQQDMIAFSMNQGSLPREFVRLQTNGEKQHIEMDWEPIVGPDAVTEKIMVTIRDVTELKKLQEQSERNRIELTILNQLLNTSSDRFLQFASNATDLLHKAIALIESSRPETIEPIPIAFRHLHTLKGNSRLLGFMELASQVHDCETQVDRLAKGAVKFDSGQQSVLDSIRQIEAKLNEYRVTFENRLMGFHSLSRNHRELRLIQMLERKRAEWQRSLPEAGQQISDMLAALQQKTLNEMIEPLQQNLAQLAKALGKEKPLLIVDGGELLLDESMETLLTNILIHLLSNSLHHGLEKPASRLKAGKQSQGRIHIKAEDHTQHLQFVLFDDGRGLNLPIIKAKAIKQGLITEQDGLTDQDIANLIFLSGFSTAEDLSQSAGRGVGMDAIRDIIHEAGGSLELHLNSGTPFDRKSFEVRFVVPRAAASQEKSAA